MARGAPEMTLAKRLTLDANILLRGVFGMRVRSLLEKYEDTVAFYSPEVCFEDARKYIPNLAARRNSDPTIGLLVLDQLERIVQTVDRSIYEAQEKSARDRMSARDIEDWPIVATALPLDCPIWTEDQDFFGTGVATWTTGNIELFLRHT
jgi:predicted nucleic acid-binding protein